MKNSFGFILILAAMVIFGFRISKGIEFKQNVRGYLKRAADSNTIQLANEEISKAINYLDANNITSGFTSVLYKTPDEDIDFWYRNLKASQNELQTLSSKSALERTNVLIKLRETLLDTGEKTKVTFPEGLHLYPYNKLWAVLTIIALGCLCYGFIIIAMHYDKLEQVRKKKEVSDVLV